MKKFVFKFSVVLEARKVKEKEALRYLATTQKAFQAEIERKAYLISQLQGALVRRENLGLQPARISVFQAEQDYIVGTKQRIVQADQAIMRATRAVQKALRDYLVARKESMAMETLRDQAYADYKQQLLKGEQKALDDLMVMRARLKEDII